MATPAYRLKPEAKMGPLLRALTKCYGEKKQGPAGDPLAVLIRGVLSQNTTDVNSHRAYQSLMDEFGDWQGIAKATRKQIARSIRSGGLPAQKAAAIKAIMAWLGRQGTYSLDFLRGSDSEEVERQLTAIKGVGIKTARLVLLFGFGRPVFVVDTHVLRVSKRLGLIPANCSRQKAHILLDDLVPDSRKYSGHLNLIEHGRRTCRSRAPLCDECPLRNWCLYVWDKMD